MQLPSAEDVEFWVAPEKAGWLQSQGDHIKTWRRRWFVLKQGYLFRFASPDVTSASKPRGLVDLSKARDRMHAHYSQRGNNTLLYSWHGPKSLTWTLNLLCCVVKRAVG